MNVAVAIQTWDMHRTGRAEMFARTWDSVARANPAAMTVITNGSTDGTSDDVRRLGGIVDDTSPVMAYGMRRAIEWAIGTGCELVVFSADDIEYRDRWLERLVAFWQAAPPIVKLASCLVERDYPWATVHEAADCGGQRILLRDSVPGCSWTFRAADWPVIGPLPETSPGEDLTVCQRLRRQGYMLAALDLGEHLGEHASAWSNRSAFHHPELDRAKWGI